MKGLRAVVLAAACAFGVATTSGCDRLMNAVLEMGLEAFTEQVQADLADNPVILSQIGEIQKLEVDMERSGLLPGEYDFAFDITGSKGSGQLIATCITIDADTEDVTAGTLTVRGQSFDLFPDGAG